MHDGNSYHGSSISVLSLKPLFDMILNSQRDLTINLPIPLVTVLCLAGSFIFHCL